MVVEGREIAQVTRPGTQPGINSSIDRQAEVLVPKGPGGKMGRCRFASGLLDGDPVPGEERGSPGQSLLAGIEFLEGWSDSSV